MRMRGSVLSWPAVATAALFPFVVHAATWPGTFPFDCSINEVCNEDGVCVRPPGIFFKVLRLSRDDDRLSLSGLGDPRTWPLGFFETLEDADLVLADDGLGQDFGHFLIPDPRWADAVGFYLYGVETRDGVSTPSGTYVNISCRGVRAL